MLVYGEECFEFDFGGAERFNVGEESELITWLREVVLYFQC